MDYASINTYAGAAQQLELRLAVPFCRLSISGLCGPQSYSKRPFSALQALLGSARLYFSTHPLQMAYASIPRVHHYPLSHSNNAECQVCHTALWHISLLQALVRFNSRNFVGDSRWLAPVTVAGKTAWEHLEVFFLLFFWVLKLYGHRWW